MALRLRRKVLTYARESVRMDRVTPPETSFPQKGAHIRLTVQPVVRDDEVEHCALAVAEGHLFCVEPRVEIEPRRRRGSESTGTASKSQSRARNHDDENS